MAELFADSTNILSYTPTQTLDALTVALYDDAGAAVTIAGTPTATAGVWSVTIQSSEVAGAHGVWRVEWTATKGTQVFTDTEYLDVVSGDGAGVFLTALKEEVGITTDAEDATLTRQIRQALAVLRSKYRDTFPTVPKATETRVRFVDGKLAMMPQAVTVTAITDSDASALDFTQTDSQTVYLKTDHTGHINVTGTWGYDEYDDDIIRAVVVTAATYYRRRSFADEGPYRGGGMPIPTEAADILFMRRVGMV